MTPMHVPKDIMDAYESQSGFSGLGQFIEQFVGYYTGRYRDLLQ